MAEKKKSDAPSELLLDKRLVERQIAKGSLSRAEFEKQIKDLPDLADRADNIASIVYPQNN
ncbi:MAG: hypothetical protein Q8O67_07130 [Deltaproteobacteria bacterium]|nr:hypothetical protein [Deltaproteobacteria bacterium]